jgi:hypothetical protein
MLLFLRTTKRIFIYLPQLIGYQDRMISMYDASRSWASILCSVLTGEVLPLEGCFLLLLICILFANIIDIKDFLDMPLSFHTYM